MAKKVYIEASSITEPKISGIGHITYEIIHFLENHSDYGTKFEVILLAGYDRTKEFKKWGFKRVKIKALPSPQRVINLIWKFNLLPPVDLYAGKGIYIFPNYKKWPLLFSKSITYVHDLGFLVYPQYVAPKNQVFLEKNMPKWLKSTTYISTDSMSAKKDILHFYKVPESKIKVMYHGVDLDFFKPQPSNKVTSVKAKYGIKGEYLLYFGNIEPRKNLIRLVDAYSQLPMPLKNKYSLVIAGGSGWLNEDIIEAIKLKQREGNKIVTVFEFVPDEDLPALYTGAKILVHPALYEGFGLSILQSMACGTPAITSNVSSMPEIVDSAGILINPKDVSAIESAMNKLLNDQTLLDSLSAKSIKRAADFTWSSTVDKLVNLIGDM